MDVLLRVTGPGPLWTSTRPSLRDPRYKPSPAAFGRFSRAVAQRYGDKVDKYLIWNEPNQPGWLRPQAECRGRRCTIEAAHVYRGLLAAAGSQIKRADRGAEIIIGELAPLGHDRLSAGAPTKPLPFLRTMSCVNESYRRISTRACRRFRAPTGDAFGYHPHPKQIGRASCRERV